MRFQVEGANRETGEPVSFAIDAESSQEAERKAQDLGLMVSSVRPDASIHARRLGGVPGTNQLTPETPKAPAWLLVLAGGMVVLLVVIASARTGGRDWERPRPSPPQQQQRQRSDLVSDYQRDLDRITAVERYQEAKENAEITKEWADWVEENYGPDN